MLYETLLSEAESIGISVDEHFHFNSRLKGLYVEGNIALSHTLKNSYEKNCILAEELGHFYTSSGDIIDPSPTLNKKQERHARIWAYQKLVSFEKLIFAFENHCSSFSELAEYLEVTEGFLYDAISYYKGKYGAYIKREPYILYFEPLGILEMY